MTSKNGLFKALVNGQGPAGEACPKAPEFMRKEGILFAVFCKMLFSESDALSKI